MKRNLLKFFRVLLAKEDFVIERKRKIKKRGMKKHTVKITWKILPVVKSKKSKVFDLKSHRAESKIAKLIFSFLNKMRVWFKKFKGGLKELHLLMQSNKNIKRLPKTLLFLKALLKANLLKLWKRINKKNIKKDHRKHPKMNLSQFWTKRFYNKRHKRRSRCQIWWLSWLQTIWLRWKRKNFRNKWLIWQRSWRITKTTVELELGKNITRQRCQASFNLKQVIL